METSAGFILFRDGKFLFLVHREGHLDFPKGHVERGESLLEAAFRETEEETGLGKANIQIIEGFRCEMMYKYGWFRKKKVIMFLGEITSGSPKVSKEHHGLRWIPIRDAPSEVKFPEQKKCIRDAIHFLEEMQYI